MPPLLRRSGYAKAKEAAEGFYNPKQNPPEGHVEYGQNLNFNYICFSIKPVNHIR
jgi:hypothetical protein